MKKEVPHTKKFESSSVRSYESLLYLYVLLVWSSLESLMFFTHLTWFFTWYLQHLKCKDLVDIPYLLPRCEPITGDDYKDFNISTVANVQVTLIIIIYNTVKSLMWTPLLKTFLFVFRVCVSKSLSIWYNLIYFKIVKYIVDAKSDGQSHVTYGVINRVFLMQMDY